MKKTFLGLALMSLTLIALSACSNSGGKNGPGDGGFGGGGAQGPQPDRGQQQPGGGGMQPAPIDARPAALSCMITGGANDCFEVAAGAMTRAEMDQTAQQCQAQHGAFAATPCTPSNHVGTCNVVSDGKPLKIRFYTPLTAANVQQICTQQNGQFQPNY